MQNFSLHMHTFGFDGRNTEEEMVLQAQKLGMKEIGFSNHFIVYPTIESAPMYVHAFQSGYASIYSSNFTEAIAKFISHYNKIDELRAKYDIKIYKGMEVDFFNHEEWKSGFAEARKILQPDYLIGSAHFIEYKNTLYNSHDLKKSSPAEQNFLLHRYWQNVRTAADSGLFDFLAHLDLMKKVGLGIDDKWIEEENKTVKAIKKSGVKVELNTSYYKFGKDEPYPGKRIMQMLAEQQVPVLLSDDAHAAKQIGWYFEQATMLAKRFDMIMLQKPQSVLRHFNNDIFKNKQISL